MQVNSAHLCVEENEAGVKQTKLEPEGEDGGTGGSSKTNQEKQEIVNKGFGKPEPEDQAQIYKNQGGVSQRRLRSIRIKEINGGVSQRRLRSSGRKWWEEGRK